MADLYIGTPNTDHDYTKTSGDFNPQGSPEKSFLPPTQHRDLVSQLRGENRTGPSLKTPRIIGRQPLSLVPNANRPRDGITPLMKSAVRNNISKRMSSRRSSLQTPGLPKLGDSAIYSEYHSSSIVRNDDTPAPEQFESSIGSTPLAQLPGHSNTAVVTDGNVMTLREQEGVIDKIEKENFGLKMKIHFLEENLSRRGGDFNQAALKENTDLKVNKITMQKELHKFKKTIAQAEKDAERYRRELEEYKERRRQKHADESVKIEVTSLRTELQERSTEYEQLKFKYESAKSRHESEQSRLRDQLDDLQADLRDRDRQLETRDEEIDELRTKQNQGTGTVDELEDDLAAARQELIDVQNELDQTVRKTEEAEARVEAAERDRQRAEDDLQELQGEMADKSFVTKGSSRQLQERATRFEEQYKELQVRFSELQVQVDEKTDAERQLQATLRDLQNQKSSEQRRGKQDYEAVTQQRDTLERKLVNLTQQHESLQKEFVVKKDEKDLLQSRHDALTFESATLQAQMAAAQNSLKSLEAELEYERQKAGQDHGTLRQHHRLELGQVSEQVDVLQPELKQVQTAFDDERERWLSQRRQLLANKDASDQKVKSLQHSVDRFNDIKTGTTDRESRLQESFEDERKRWQSDAEALQKQIRDLESDLSSKRTASETHRQEIASIREELRISLRDQALLKEKQQELEDEIEVLQADLEQGHELAQQLQEKSSQSKEAQLSTLRKEKADLQAGLASMKIDLQVARDNIQSLQIEKDELQKAQKSQDDTFDAQSRRRNQERQLQTLEKELAKTRAERDALAQSNQDLEAEVEAEIERATEEENKLNAEIQKLLAARSTLTDTKDRELMAARAQIARLESQLIETQRNGKGEISAALGDPDVSLLQSDLAKSREKEAEATRKEAALRKSHRELKIKVNELENDLHEARLAELKSQSPSSVSSTGGRQLSELRQEVFDIRSRLKTMQDENSSLKRQARETVSKERVTSREQLDNKAEEMVRLNEKLQVYKGTIASLQKELDNNRRHFPVDQVTETSLNLRREIERLRTERDLARETSIKLASNTSNREMLALKRDLARLRIERTAATKQARTVETELDAVQARYEAVLDTLSSNHKDHSLLQEIIWLKARFRREQRLRQDLAWSKSWLENSEAMRVQCNQIDLRILHEMGVQVDRARYERELGAKQKLRAGVFVVMASIRMRNILQQWRTAKRLETSGSLR